MYIFCSDSGETAYISIWDKLACKVRNDLDQLQGEPLIVIVTGVNPKPFVVISKLIMFLFKFEFCDLFFKLKRRFTIIYTFSIEGELYLNTTASIRFYWNKENDVTKDFRKR